MKLHLFSACLAFLVLGAADASAQTQGVGKQEILVGSILDLTGPLAPFGKQVRNGLQLRLQEANEQGGINGRMVRLLVEDSSYDPAKAAVAARKLVNDEQIFTMIGSLGTAINLAAMPVQFARNVVNLYPVATAREMYEPLHRLKYSFAASYFDQMRIGAPKLMRDRNLGRPCVLYQDDSYGHEVLAGAEAGLRTNGAHFVQKASYVRGATEFSGQVAQMKAAGCDLVVLGTVIRETIGAIAEARKMGFQPTFLVSSAAYSELIPKLGGKPMDGLFAVMTAQHPYPDASEQAVRLWAGRYKARFGEDPTVFSVYGYLGMDAFVRAARKAGPNLTSDSFVAAMDTLTIPRDMFGTPETSFSPTKRLGNPYTRLSQLQDGRWRVVSEFVAFNGLKPVLQKDGRWKIGSEYFRDLEQ